MIELADDTLIFSFPEVHPEATVRISFQRTLRIPDDGSDYPLPPGLGRFPMRHVDDYKKTVPATWLERGGVMLPMYQSEAMWIKFDAGGSWNSFNYPMAIKIAAGKVNAVTGGPWRDGLQRDPQDYVVIPRQPWLDGFCVEKGIIRQFVAMPLGTDYTVEEQVTGMAEFGGLQISARPLRREAYEWRRRKREEERAHFAATRACFSRAMGLAAGGRMRQEIFDDPYAFDEWDDAHVSRCFVHIANSDTWSAITGHMPPGRPPTARDYVNAGLPWFDYYSEEPVVDGSSTLAGVKSVSEMDGLKGKEPDPDDAPVQPGVTIPLGRPRRRPVREHSV